MGVPRRRHTPLSGSSAEANLGSEPAAVAGNSLGTGVATKHKQYRKFMGQWRKCRVVIEGSEAVKEAGQEFLPKLSDQEEQEYDDYKKRALFYEASLRTAQGIQGMLVAKRPELSGPQTPEEFVNEMIMSNLKWLGFVKELCRELIEVGRVGILIDISESGKPYLAVYTAESIVNWKVDYIDKKAVASKVVLEETVEDWNGFQASERKRYRVLCFNSSGNYCQQVFDTKEESEDVTLEDEVEIKINGKPLKEIPFFIMGVNGGIWNVSRPPLLGIVNLNISHYMSSADLEHGRHFTGLPTPWVSGFELGGERLVIGSQRAWVSSDPQARASFLEFTGQGLTTLERALNEKETLMAVVGSRLLETPRNVAESAENQTLRKTGENSIVANLADTVSDVFSMVLNKAAEFKGIDISKKKYKLLMHKDYISAVPDPGLYSTLLQGYQMGAVSFETLFYNMRRMNMVEDGVTVEEEVDRIDNPEFKPEASEQSEQNNK